MRLKLWSIILTTALLSLNVSATKAAPNQLSVNAKFSGTLIENLSSCTIYPGDENITLPFPSISTKDLRITPETRRFPFTIRLENCESAQGVARNVKVYLAGNANNSGMLLFDQGSEAQGVTIGIENSEGTFLPVNSPSPSLILPLNVSVITINLQAFLKVDNITLLTAGDYRASLNYILEYE